VLGAPGLALPEGHSCCHNESRELILPSVLEGLDSDETQGVFATKGASGSVLERLAGKQCPSLGVSTGSAPERQAGKQPHTAATSLGIHEQVVQDYDGRGGWCGQAGTCRGPSALERSESAIAAGSVLERLAGSQSPSFADASGSALERKAGKQMHTSAATASQGTQEQVVQDVRGCFGKAGTCSGPSAPERFESAVAAELSVPECATGSVRERCGSAESSLAGSPAAACHINRDLHPEAFAQAMPRAGGSTVTQAGSPAAACHINCSLHPEASAQATSRAGGERAVAADGVEALPRPPTALGCRKLCSFCDRNFCLGDINHPGAAHICAPCDEAMHEDDFSDEESVDDFSDEEIDSQEEHRMGVEMGKIVYDIVVGLHEQDAWTSLEDVVLVAADWGVPEEAVDACIETWVEGGILGVSPDGRQLKLVVKPESA
jgi:hypothetical protein